MKLSVSAYRAQAAAHKKILSTSNYQSTGYSAGTSNPSACLASSILHAVPPTTQTDDDNECTISVTKSSLTSNNTMNSRNADQTNSDDQSVSLYCGKEDLNDKQTQKNKANPRWIKLRTTVQISSAIQKKPSLKREDSFLKRFSTRPPAVTQETIEDTCSDGPTSEEGNKSWFYHPYQKKRKRKRMRSSHPISVVNPDQDFYFYWLFILTICVLYNLWTLIVRQSFPELQKLIENAWLACDAISDIVFVLDIVVQLRTGYLEQGLMVYNSRKLACHYLQSKSFIFDICALCPLDLLQIRFGTQPLLRFPRFLKVYRAVNYYYIVESRTVWPNLWRVANLIHILLILAHWFGCFYFLLSEVERFQGDWVYPYRPGEYSTLARKYLGSFYWATLTLTTIGDLPTPETNSEYLFTIVSYLIGVFIFATIVGQVGNVITNRNANRLEFERLLDGAKMYMRHHKVPSGMKRRVLRWYDYSWSRGRIQGGGDINTALGLLPDKLKTELALHVNLSVLKKVTIFQECQPEFLHDLVLKMKAYIFTPGDTICRKGEVAREMFIIADGILEVLNEHGKVLTTMKAGDFFGEIGILNLDGLNKRTADVRSVGYSELFSLSREDVLSAMKDYPEAQEILQALGRKRLMEVKNSANKKRVLNQSNKSTATSSKDGIVDKIKHEAKQSIRSVLKKTKTISSQAATASIHDNSTEMPPMPSSTEGSFRNRPKGRLRRMSRVKSDEANPDDDHVTEINQAATMSPSSSSSSKNITPIGAGLPLLARLKLLKEKQEQEEKSRNPTVLSPLSVLKEMSLEDRIALPVPERNMNKVNFITNLIPFSTSGNTDAATTTQSSWTTLKTASFKKPITNHDIVRKDYESVKDLSPELFELPFAKKLKLLNKRQQLSYLRSFSLDPPKPQQEIKRTSSDNCLLSRRKIESSDNDKKETCEGHEEDIGTNAILYTLRNLINSGFDDVYRKIESKFDGLYEAIEGRDTVMNDFKLRLEELEKFSRDSSLETVIERAPEYENPHDTSDHKQNCPVCTSQTVLEIDEKTANWELEMLAEQLSRKQNRTPFDKRSVSLDFVDSEDTEENDASFEGDNESNRLLRHKKYKRRKTVPRTSSNESDV